MTNNAKAKSSNLDAGGIGLLSFAFCSLPTTAEACNAGFSCCNGGEASLLSGDVSFLLLANDLVVGGIVED